MAGLLDKPPLLPMQGMSIALHEHVGALCRHSST